MNKKRSFHSSSEVRYLVAHLLLFCVSLVALGRLFYIQVIQHKKYILLAEDQHWGKYSIKPSRGEIYSDDGYLLAGNQTYYLLFADPSKVKSPKDPIEKLADIFYQHDLNRITQETTDAQKLKSIAAVLEEEKKASIERYTSLLSRSGLWVPLKNAVDPNLKNEISMLNLEGFGFEEEPTRYYPEGVLASHVLGFVASDKNGEKRGYNGVEGTFNDTLRGRPGFVMQEVDAKGVPLLIGGEKGTQAIPGNSIYISINRTIQHIVEEKLKEGVEKFDAKSGSVIVMDPFTGDILAMANYPTYHPSDFSEKAFEEDATAYRKSVERKNLAIADTYEPGSVMKPFTVAAAIDKGLVNPNSTFIDNGPVEYSGKFIDNWNHQHPGKQNIIQLLQKSNNIGAAWVGHLVGRKGLYDYLRLFGMGERTDIDLEGEDSGLLHNYDSWTDIDLANISFGQGMSATTLQVLTGFNAFANGGYLVKPRIIKWIADSDKKIEVPVTVRHRIIKKETADTMVDLLEQAASGGEAQWFVLKNYRIGGKTGTGQIIVDGNYAPDITNATFIGFLSGSRKYSMLVRLQEPRVKSFASETATPIWMEITSELVKYFNLPPDK